MSKERERAQNPKLLSDFTLTFAKLSLAFKTFFELVYTTAGVYEFLLAGEERMAFGTNFHMVVTFCRLCIYNFAARAIDLRVNVVRMYSFFHC